MLVGVFHFEDHRDFREEGVAPGLFEVLAGFEHHAVFARFKRLLGREQFANATLFVSHTLAQHLPVLAHLLLQGDVNAR